MARNLVLLGSLLMIGLLAFLTIAVVISDGVTVVTITALLLLGLLGVGVLGALTGPGE